MSVLLPVGREGPNDQPRQRISAAASTLRVARKVMVAVIGLSVLAFGVALIVLPGPAILVIPLGLAILATEFLWAGKLLRQLGKPLRKLKARARQMLGKPPEPARPEAWP